MSRRRRHRLGCAPHAGGAVHAAPAALLQEPIRNPMLGAPDEELERSQPKSFAAGMDMILADENRRTACSIGYGNVR
jgi:hypothetical protein